MRPSTSVGGGLEAAARRALEAAWGESAEAVESGQAPGRCTIVGEHVDYADGVVVCVGVDLTVAAAARPSGAGRWRVVSNGRVADRATPAPVGDWADRTLAVPIALRGAGVRVPPVEIALVATLPPGAGLASSAALGCAVAVALLRLAGARLGPSELAVAVLAAERDVVGVPCGPLDQRAVVDAPAGGALLLDLGAGSARRLPWTVGDHALVVCDTGAPHDVGGAAYRERRTQADAARAALGIRSWRDADEAWVDAAELPDPLRRRARHIITETARARRVPAALEACDAAELGRLMRGSHASLRDDYEVSTPRLDAAVAAAERVVGCRGARMVGGGFGGSAVALVVRASVETCRLAMADAAGCGVERTWVVEPAPGVAARAPDVLG